MGRLSARTSADREIHLHLKDAAKAMTKALAIADRESRKPDLNPLLVRRARGIYRLIRGALGLVESVGTIQPSWDLGDPDLEPEDQKKPPLPTNPVVGVVQDLLGGEG